MSNYTLEKQLIPCLTAVNGIVKDINQAFINLSDFSKKDILNKTLNIVWNELLRITTPPNLIQTHKEAFLFTQSLNPKEIFITVSQVENKKLFTFIEKNEFTLKDKFPYIHNLLLSNIQGVAIFAITPDIVLLNANETYFDFLDSPFNNKYNSIGKPIHEFITGWKGSTSEEIWKKVLSNGDYFYTEEYMYDRFERGITYWKATLMPIYENNKIKYIIEVTEEITESVLNKQRIEEQSKIIQTQKNELEAVIQSIPDAVYLIDKNEKFYLINKEAEKRTPSQTIHTIHDLHKSKKYYSLTGEEIYYDMTPALRALKGEKIVNFKIVVKQNDKEYICDLTATPIFDELGNVSKAIVCSHDITQLIEQKTMLKEQKEQLERIIEHIPDAMVVFDKNGNIIRQNAEARKIHPHLSITNYLNQAYNDYQFFDLENNIISAENLPTTRAFKGEKIQNERILIKDLNKNQVIVINSTSIFDEKKDLKWVISSQRDVTDHVNKQQQLIDAEKEKNEALQASIKAKDEFVYLITHEFRTPMTVVNSALQAIDLLYKDEVTPTIKKYLNKIKQNSNRQLRLVNNLLDITKMSSDMITLNMKVIDIIYVTKAILQSVDVYAKQKEINIWFESDMAKKNIVLDEEKYERILLNLLSNALKFTPRGKSITVSISSKEKKEKDMICIDVKDEGIGIPKEKQKIIFERFGQADTSLSRQAEGTGLGLHLLKLLVDALQGEISLKSTEGNGSTFTISLPIGNPTSLENSIDDSKVLNKFIDANDRIIQAASIEFSDIYFE